MRSIVSAEITFFFLEFCLNEVLNELSANDINFANFEKLSIFTMDDKWGVEFP